jgi:hypothetical protein
MNHLHIPVDTIPYTFNAVAVIAFGDVAVASGTFFILVDVVNDFRPPWMLVVLIILGLPPSDHHCHLCNRLEDALLWVQRYPGCQSGSKQGAL